MNTLGLALTSAITSSAGMTAWATSAVDPGSAGTAAYLGGGAGVIAVGALAEVLRRLLSGRLIPREIKEVEEEIGAAIVASAQREALLMERAESMRKSVEDMRDEVRSLRRAIEGGRP